MEERFRLRLQREFDERRQANRRYSLRAFAAFLETDHSTLSQILRSQRTLPLARIRQWAKKLGIEPELAAAYIAAEHLPDPQSAARESQMRHWTAEAGAVVMNSVHWRIFDLCQSHTVPGDSRSVAAETNASIDDVNIAFSRLLRLGLVRTSDKGRWMVTTGDKVKTERQFQRIALTRVREKAAEFSVKLPAMLRIR
jgi:transcriptional regulator with XRE-family HTH domain